MSLYVCGVCSKGFGSSQGLNGHSRIHRDTWEASRQQQREAHAEQSEQFRAAHRALARGCLKCGAVFDFEQTARHRYRNFCDNRCSAAHNNKSRPRPSPETKGRTRATLLARSERLRLDGPTSHPAELARALPHGRQRRAFESQVAGPYSRLMTCTCRTCGKVWKARAVRVYCEDHQDQYSAVARQGYLFAFNPFQHPDIFDAETLAWCAAVGPYSHANRAGWTRDHKVSVSEAIREGHDPFYIRHPLNCEVMTFASNNRKKGGSSMSYDELVAMVDRYEVVPR